MVFSELLGEVSGGESRIFDANSLFRTSPECVIAINFGRRHQELPFRSLSKIYTAFASMEFQCIRRAMFEQAGLCDTVLTYPSSSAYNIAFRIFIFLLVLLKLLKAILPLGLFKKVLG